MQTFPLATYSDISYDDIARNGSDDQFLTRQANLVLNDVYYSRLYHSSLATMSHQEAVHVLIAAGCFDDMLDERVVFNTYFMSAPYTMVKRAYNNAKAKTDKMAIIVATGSYDPLHEGHIESVAKAKEYIESNGTTVIAGFMSPSHDTYVRRKNPGGEVDFHRIHENMIFLENSLQNQPQWIFHENWETLGIDASTNFTDVVTYIDGMMKAHVGNDVDIYYVFGSDNASFGLAFDHNDSTLAKGICVGRPGYTLSESMEKTIDTSSTLFYMAGQNGMSSTQVRAQRQATEKKIEKTTVGLPYVIRDDLVRSTQWLEKFITAKELTQRQEAFKMTLVDTFNKSFSNVQLLDVDHQLKVTKNHLKENYDGKKVLSCDVYLQGDKTLRASRLFDLAGSQHHGKAIHFDSATPIDVSDPTDYVFVDDDIVSGFFLSQIKEKYSVTDAVAMANLVTEGKFLDIVDARDFVVGGVYGGLMVEAETPFRVPYLTPFVNLISRASMPANDIRVFNREIWGANENFYKGTNITVGDLPNDQGAFLYYMGFDATATIESICHTYGKSFR